MGTKSAAIAANANLTDESPANLHKDVRMNHSKSMIAAVMTVFCVFLPIVSAAADWNQWGYDAGRRHVSPEQLPDKLNLKWSRKLPTPRPAWPRSQTKLQFDASYEMVVMGSALFVTSMVTDSVTAYDILSGEEEWRFYTNGPVRFAPVAMNGNVYFVSDDGYLYCVGATDGSLKWKFCGGPGSQAVLGNDRLTSMWVARGAPVYADGRIYFAASIWPFMGTFIYALDAESGTVVWKNTGSGSIYIMQEHDSPSFAGVAPQGYLGVQGDVLLVSGGRTVPAGYDVKTGRLLYYHLSSRQFGKGAGGFQLSASGEYFFNGGVMYCLADGTGLTRVRSPLVSADTIYSLDDGKLTAYQLTPERRQEADKKGNQRTVGDLKRRWVATVSPAPSQLFIKAGDSIYVSTPEGVAALDVSIGRESKVVWQHSLASQPFRMVAAHGHLFVSTLDGTMHCFSGGDPTARLFPLDSSISSGKDNRIDLLTEAILKEANTKKGYCIVVGIGSGEMIRSLLKLSGMHLMVVEPNAKKVRELRDSLYTWNHVPAKPDKAKEKYITVDFPDTWQVIGPLSKGFPQLTGAQLKHIPTKIVEKGKSFKAQPLRSVNSLLDFSALYGGYGLQPLGNGVSPDTYPRTGSTRSSEDAERICYAYTTIICTESGKLLLGAGADWWMEWYIDGEKVYSTLSTGNDADPCSPTNHVFAVDVEKGEHVIAVMVKAGSAGWVMASDSRQALQRHLKKDLVSPVFPSHRIHIIEANPFGFQFPPYIADLVVCEDLGTSGYDKRSDINTLLNALRPYGGVACFSGAEKLLAERIGAVKVDGVKSEKNAQFVIAARRGALPASASWSHQYADAGNSIVSRDKRVKAPLGLLWFGGPSNDKVLPRHGHGPSPQVAGGRLYIEGRDMIRCVDVYTGRLLWDRAIKNIGLYYDNTKHHPGANEIGSNYVSLKDGVFVISPDKCLRLNPATGDTVREYTIKAKDNRMPNWGFITVSDDTVIATAEPVVVPLGNRNGADNDKKTLRPGGMRALVERAQKWRYLAGKHPDSKLWTSVDYNDRAWKEGIAGFGYGDEDDKTELKGMRKQYSAVYIRHLFNIDDVSVIEELALMINYDDAFIAYINGHEVGRSTNIMSGNGASVRVSNVHEAEGAEKFVIDSPEKYLIKGKNVLAVEGHNADSSSSDFSLDPWLMVKPTDAGIPQAKGNEGAEWTSIEGVEDNASYASGSRMLVAMDKETGEVLWTRRAKFNFRHNAIAAGDGYLFCIDRLSVPKMAHLKRRGFEAKGSAVLYALDIRTGRVKWESSSNIHGTWLGYSKEHRILLQGGSRGRDRARDESGQGMTLHSVSDGKVVWHSADGYEGPCMLYRDMIFAQGKAYDIKNGNRYVVKNPLTGSDMELRYSRNHGCNTAIGSENLILFRSAAAGYFDMVNYSGTGNMGGFKSGCTSNLIVADGILNAPDYTRTCSCSYQNQSSLGLIHMPGVETWTFNANINPGTSRVKRVGFNFAAPGDRLSDTGTLWLDSPSVGGPGPKITVTFEPAEEGEPGQRTPAFQPNRVHESGVTGELPWVAASGLEGVTKITMEIAEGATDSKKYTVRLIFSEIVSPPPENRVFDVLLQGKKVITELNVFKKAAKANRSLVLSFNNISIKNVLQIELQPVKGGTERAIISGVEIIAE